MKRIIFIMAAALSLAACNQNTPDEPKRGDTQTNQPANPSTWSPAGHRYAYTYEDGIKSVACYGMDSIFSYQTPNEDYSINETFEYTYQATEKYTLDYPTITIYGKYTVTMTFIDTTKIYYKGNDMTFLLID